MNKFSVIIPVYNASRFLRECLDSVCAAVKALEKAIGAGESTGSPLVEVICVDDGSTDGSSAILEEYKNSFLHLHTATTTTTNFRVIHQKNAGVSAARNAALEVAKGEYITFIDADDTIEPYWFASAAKLIAANSPDLVRLGEKWGRFKGEQGTFEGPAAAKWAWTTLSDYGYLWLCFIRRDVIGDLRFRPVINCKEDGIFLMELAPKLKKVCQGDYAGYRYRMCAGSLTKKNRRVAQSVAYLTAYREIWQAQSAWTKEMGIAELVRRQLRFGADHDVWEWQHQRRSDDTESPKKIRAAYLALEQSGALWPGWCHPKKRLWLPFMLWRKTGWLMGFQIMDAFVKLVGNAKKIVTKKVRPLLLTLISHSLKKYDIIRATNCR